MIPSRGRFHCLSVAWIALFAGCSETPNGLSQIPAPSGSPPSNSALGPSEQLVITSLHDGPLFTNAPATPRLSFSLEPRFGAPETHRLTLEARMTFASSGGRSTPVELQAVEPKLSDPGLGHRFDILPSRELSPDQWHALVVTSDDSLTVTGAASTSWTWRLPFFTGSAPHVARLEWTAKSPASLHVRLTEPMELKEINLKSLVRQGGFNIAECVELGGKCLGADDSPALEVLVVRLQKSIADVTGLGLFLPEQAAGAGRTVKQGADAAGLSFEGKDLFAPSGPLPWHTCQDGIAQCWSASPPEQ